VRVHGHRVDREVGGLTAVDAGHHRRQLVLGHVQRGTPQDAQRAQQVAADDHADTDGQQQDREQDHRLDPGAAAGLVLQVGGRALQRAGELAGDPGQLLAGRVRRRDPRARRDTE